MNPELLEHEKQHLASLLEAVQRCVYFLDAEGSSVTWPLATQALEQRKKDKELFGALAAINERFAKLQDTLGAAMRHAMGLLSEPSETFLQVLAFFEKVGLIASTADCRLPTGRPVARPGTSRHTATKPTMRRLQSISIPFTRCNPCFTSAPASSYPTVVPRSANSREWGFCG
jgi:hypothetical protein